MTQLLRTDDKYREQYQQRIANQLNGIDAIDQLEDRYDILEKMDTRRKAKPNTDVYKQLDEEIKSECHAAKERMLTEQCDLIEQLESAHKFHRTHAQIRKVTERGNNAGVTTCIEDRDCEHHYITGKYLRTMAGVHQHTL